MPEELSDSAWSILISAKNLSCWLNGKATLDANAPNLYLDGFFYNYVRGASKSESSVGRDAHFWMFYFCLFWRWTLFLMKVWFYRNFRPVNIFANLIRFNYAYMIIMSHHQIMQYHKTIYGWIIGIWLGFYLWRIFDHCTISSQDSLFKINAIRTIINTNFHNLKPQSSSSIKDLNVLTDFFLIIQFILIDKDNNIMNPYMSDTSQRISYPVFHLLIHHLTHTEYFYVNIGCVVIVRVILGWCLLKVSPSLYRQVSNP